MRLSVSLALVLTISVLFPLTAWPRWATLEDAEYEMEFDNYSETVHADGTSEVVSELQFKLLKDGARSKVGTFPIVYNAGFESVEILEAKTIYEGKSFPVPRQNIEDKPLASNTLGFDRLNQVLVAFPHLEIGAQLYLKTKRKVRVTPIDGFYSSRYVYGTDVYERAGKVHVDSAIPLFVHVNDPEGRLKISQEKRGRRYVVDIDQLSPTYYEALEEPGSWIDPNHVPWVQVASRDTWTAMGDALVARYEKVLKQPLPAAFAEIAAAAAKRANFADRVNEVTSRLAALVTYKGDWKTVAGRYVPRDLAAIADTRLGDCKDFAASTAAILRRLGLDAHLALVRRGAYGQDPPEFEKDLPYLQAFNHAIVFVKDGAAVHWIDPTNSTSFAQGLYTDIADRRALVLNADHAELLHIPALQAADSKASLSQVAEFDGHDSAHMGSTLTMTGAMAVPWTGASLRNSKQVLDYALIRFFGDEKDITDWKFSDYDLSSRVVSDLSFHVDFKERNTSLNTSAGYAFMLPDVGENVLVKTEGRVSDLYLGVPQILGRQTHLENVSQVGERPLDCHVESPWLTAERKVKSDSSGVTIDDTLTINRPRISNADLVSPEYSKMRAEMERCLEKVAIVYTLKNEGSRLPANH